MTFATQKARFVKQMKLYIQFLQYCSTEKELFKLLAEIQFLKLKIEKINRMTMSEASQEVPCITKEFESNFDNI